MPSTSPYQQAQDAYDSGSLRRALQLCAKVAPDDPERIDAQALAAECHAELGEWAEAEATAKQVLAEDPEWPTGHFILAVAAMRRAAVDEAEKHLDRALLFEPEFAEAAFLRSAVADYCKSPEDADRWLARAHRADPEEYGGPLHLSANDVDDLLLEAVAEWEGQTEDTLEECRFRLRDMPDEADVRAGVGLESVANVDELDAEGDPPSFRLTLYQRNLERGAKNREEILGRIYEALEEALGVLAEAVEAADSDED